MFGWDDAQDSHQQVYNSEPDNQGSFGHEVIAGGAAFAGMKMFEDHQRKEGKPVSHAFAKELLAGFVGGEVDKLAETHGMNEYDKYEARKHATQGAEGMYDSHYQRDLGADQYDPNQYNAPPQLGYGDNNY